MSVIEKVRQDRVDLARVLKKHTGIRRIVEELYPDSAHFIYELLQNAEDTGATEVTFVLTADRLVFKHNGRTFDEADIWSITDIGEGTKVEDDEQIGRFGIGFKAVFAYTETPRIWSPSYAFKISDMVLPSEIPLDMNLGDQTKFEFPFNSVKKSQAEAFSEVRAGLEEISENTLLFLSNIEGIQWRIDGGQEGLLLRMLHTDHHIEILREIDGKQTESANFFRFTKSVAGLEKQHVAIAFELEPVSEHSQLIGLTPFAKQFRIVPSERGCVAVYFTAAKETSNLYFHLHAPFVPELSRSSIKDTPANAPLFTQLAELAAESLLLIRDLDLLDREFLAVLPNSQDEIPAQYTSIRDAIVDAMNGRALTPKHVGGHAPASRLLQAEAGLKDLLGHDDIHFLIDNLLDWGIAATQRNNRVDRFLRDLDIKPWGIKQFVKVLSRRLNNRGQFCYLTYTRRQGPDEVFLDWIRQKSLEWHRSLYALFYRELEDELCLFDQICIVRHSDGKYGIGSESYFPTPETREDPIHPRVAEDTYAGGRTKKEQINAKAFLAGIGVREVGEFQQVEAILKQRYTDSTDGPLWKIHQSDLKRFITFADKDKSASSLFESYFILQGADYLWHRPANLYLDAPYLETGLEAYYESLESESGCTALSDNYRAIDVLDQLIPFARMCGVADHLEIATVSCNNNPKWSYLRSAPGTNWTVTGINRDFAIPGLDILFEQPTLALSRLVWNTLCRRSKDKNILKATFQYNQSNLPHSDDSQLVHQLRDTAWVPQKNNVFVRPVEAVRDLLPDGFPFDLSWAWLYVIRFGAESQERAEHFRRIQEIAVELGFRDKAAFDDARRFAELTPDARKRILAEYEEPIELPTREPANRRRRAKSVREKARNAPERTSKKRERSVSVNRDTVKREKTDPYLRDLYTNIHGVTICQACQDRLPFRLADGSYYFEAVEFLPALQRHHHQNYLAFCPNHAAMFRHANKLKHEMMDRFLELDGSKLELRLADQLVAVYFTDTHIADIRAIIEADDQG